MSCLGCLVSRSITNVLLRLEPVHDATGPEVRFAYLSNDHESLRLWPVSLVCGSDLHAYHARLPNTPSATEPQAITGETLPIVLGHEFSGTVVDVGKGVDEGKFHVGQNVVMYVFLIP